MEGEEVLALRRAYEAATASGPSTIGLVEAHGTGTAVGDLGGDPDAYGGLRSKERARRASCALGSVKSMISHLIPAAGIAGLIKASLSLYHAVLPPTLHCDEVNPAFALDKTPFYINTRTRPWIHGAPTPRRAAVNAFGFGGINAHAILEEHVPANASTDLHYERWDSEVCVLEADTRQGLAAKAARLATDLGAAPGISLKDVAFTLNTSLVGQTHRLALVATSTADLAHKLSGAAGKLTARECPRIRDGNGTYYAESPLADAGHVAFMFPGEGSQYPDMLADLCICFPEVRGWFDLIDRAFIPSRRDYLPSQAVFRSPGGATDVGNGDDRLWRMDCAAEVIFAANQAVLTLLRALHVMPDAVVGHSSGEYSALHAANAIETGDPADLLRDIVALNEVYERSAASGEIPTGVLLSVGAVDAEFVRAVADERRGELFVAMDNCPHQLVLSGSAAAVDEAEVRLRAAGAVCVRLPFDRAYHTPRFAAFGQRVATFFERLRIRVPDVQVYSCCTAAPLPPDHEEIRRIAAKQWSEPVRFRETIGAMYEAGVRLFVEAGPRNNLTSFVSDTLRGRPHLAVPVNVQGRSGITQLHHALAQLVAHHVPLRLGRLYSQRRPQHLTFGDAGHAAARPRIGRSPSCAAVSSRFGCPRVPTHAGCGWQPRVTGRCRSGTGARGIDAAAGDCFRSGQRSRAGRLFQDDGAVSCGAAGNDADLLEYVSRHTSGCGRFRRRGGTGESSCPGRWFFTSCEGRGKRETGRASTCRRGPATRPSAVTARYCQRKDRLSRGDAPPGPQLGGRLGHRFNQARRDPKRLRSANPLPAAR